MTSKYPKMNRKKGLYLKKVKGKGRGVFCTEDIRKGDILEVTPAIVLSDKDTAHLDKTLLMDYAFVAGGLSAALRKKSGVKKDEYACCMIMGLISFCNHGHTPNAEVLWDEADGALYHILRATRNIPKNTEICTTYGDGWFDDRDEKPAK